LHPTLEHLGLFDFFLGVAGPDKGVGVDEVDVGGWVVMISVEEACGKGSVGEVLRDGEETLKVDDSSRLSSPTVVDGSSGFPSSMSWTSAGRFVEAERNSRTLDTV